MSSEYRLMIHSDCKINGRSGGCGLWLGCVQRSLAGDILRNRKTSCKKHAHELAGLCRFCSAFRKRARSKKDADKFFHYVSPTSAPMYRASGDRTPITFASLLLEYRYRELRARLAGAADRVRAKPDELSKIITEIAIHWPNRHEAPSVNSCR